MEIRVLNGRKATDRDGAGEYLGRSVKSVDKWAEARTETGWPDPVEVETSGRGVRARGEHGSPHGREWYALDDLDRFRDDYLARVEAAAQARVHHVQLVGDPGEELSGQQFAKLLRVEYDTFRSWVRDSKDHWATGRDGYLPLPDRTEPYGRGVRRFWRLATAQRFINNRRGRGTGGGRPKTNATG